MSFSTRNTVNYLLYDTAVDNMFISEYMPSAPGEYVKVYLFALMCSGYGRPSDDEYLARELGLSVSEIGDAWDYWEDQGLVRRSRPDPGSKTGFEREFTDIRCVFFSCGSGAQPRREAAPKPVSLNDEQLAGLYRDIEGITGRMLESREPETIAAWIDEYGMDPQLIVFGYKYSKEHGKSDRSRYVGAILKDWRAKDLKCVADVEDYLSGIDRNYSAYRRIFRELGFNRNPSEPEKRIMDSWFEKMGFTMEQVLKACGKTTGIANPNLNYVNAILVSAYNSERGGAAPDAAKSPDRIYKDIREENARRTEEKREEVFTKIPRMRAIMDELKASGLKLPGLMLSGRAAAAAAERERMRELNKEKAGLLLENGFDETALDMIYTCSDCKDTGVLDDGTRCHCYAEKLDPAGR